MRTKLTIPFQAEFTFRFLIATLAFFVVVTSRYLDDSVTPVSFVAVWDQGSLGLGLQGGARRPFCCRRGMKSAVNGDNPGSSVVCRRGHGSGRRGRRAVACCCRRWAAFLARKKQTMRCAEKIGVLLGYVRRGRFPRFRRCLRVLVAGALVNAAFASSLVTAGIFPDNESITSGASRTGEVPSLAKIDLGRPGAPAAWDMPSVVADHQWTLECALLLSCEARSGEAEYTHDKGVPSVEAVEYGGEQRQDNQGGFQECGGTEMGVSRREGSLSGDYASREANPGDGQGNGADAPDWVSGEHRFIVRWNDYFAVSEHGELVCRALGCRSDDVDAPPEARASVGGRYQEAPRESAVCDIGGTSADERPWCCGCASYPSRSSDEEDNGAEGLRETQRRTTVASSSQDDELGAAGATSASRPRAYGQERSPLSGEFFANWELLHRKNPATEAYPSDFSTLVLRPHRTENRRFSCSGEALNDGPGTEDDVPGASGASQSDRTARQSCPANSENASKRGFQVAELLAVLGNSPLVKSVGPDQVSKISSL